MKKNNETSWNSLKIETVYLSDDDYQKAKIHNTEDSDKFWKLVMKPKNELLQIYMNTNDKIEKKMIEQIKHQKDNNLPFQIAKRESDFVELPTRECDIKEIDENKYI